MNRKERRMAKVQERRTVTVHLHGKEYGIEEAGALAIKEQGLGHFQSAADIYKLIIAKLPDYAEAYSNLGVIMQEMRNYKEALACYDHSIKLKTDFPGVYNNRGNTLQELRRFEEAVKSYDKAIALHPQFADAYSNRANALQQLKRYDEALLDYDHAISLRPNIAEMHNNKGAALQRLKRHDEAMVSYDEAVRLKPDYAEAYYNQGVIFTATGDMDKANEKFCKALELRPGFAHPLFSLTNIRKYEDANNPDVIQLEMLMNKPGITAEEQEQYNYTLGKIYDDCGLFDKAFAYFERANAIRNSMVSYNPQSTEEITKNIQQSMSKEFLAQKFAFASVSAAPIFIVGMPRSGTTLMASILSNHPSVGTAGELPTLTEFSLRLPKLLGKNMPYPASLASMTPEIASAFAAEYEKRLRRDIPADVPFVIDKHPLNFRHLGLIAMLFPKARIIHAMRDPMDTGLSNYFQRFTVDYDYCFDLRNIAHFYKEYEKTMAHWRSVLPIPILDVRYEDVVVDTEKAARRMIDFLRLPWDERCLAPHTNKYAVETASHWQVRQPIYKDSIGRSQHYEQHLAPLKEALGDT